MFTILHLQIFELKIFSPCSTFNADARLLFVFMYRAWITAWRLGLVDCVIKILQSYPSMFDSLSIPFLIVSFYKIAKGEAHVFCFIIILLPCSCWLYRHRSHDTFLFCFEWFYTFCYRFLFVLLQSFVCLAYFLCILFVIYNLISFLFRFVFRIQKIFASLCVFTTYFFLRAFHIDRSVQVATRFCNMFPCWFMCLTKIYERVLDCALWRLYATTGTKHRASDQCSQKGLQTSPSDLIRISSTVYAWMSVRFHSIPTDLRIMFALN